MLSYKLKYLVLMRYGVPCVSSKSKATSFLLCYLLGMFGAHRFYLRCWKTALLMLITLGGLGIWWLIDTMLIIGGKLSDADGNELRTGPSDADNLQAGFWVRFAAINVDMIIVQIALIVLGFITSIGLGIGASVGLDLSDPAAVEQFGTTAAAIMGALSLFIVPLYFGVQTASSHQATIGKRVFEIYVSSNSGAKLGLLRGMWRAMCYLLSALPVYLGFVAAAFTKDKRALHDYLAGSKVLYVPQDSVANSSPSAAPHPAPTPSLRAADMPQATAAADRGATMLIALGVLTLAAAAALALL
jgi:uncharacterized RDD family membrane protein YckC/TM2 domain-containing membrane protein YozV